MTHLKGEQRSRYVAKMFGRISKTYDRLNRMMTFGQDLKWRREAVAALELECPALVLDLGAGTGDMTVEVLHQYPDAFVIGVDLTPEMLLLARARQCGENAHWVVADVHNLPFLPHTFSATISGFLLRNLPEVDPSLSEQRRVLQNNGKFVCLETSPAKQGLLRIAIHFHIHRVIPFFGRLISNDPEAYSYLAVSTTEFLSAEKLAQKLDLSGFQEVGFVRRMLGTIAIHSALKK